MTRDDFRKKSTPWHVWIAAGAILAAGAVQFGTGVWFISAQNTKLNAAADNISAERERLSAHSRLAVARFDALRGRTRSLEINESSLVTAVENLTAGQTEIKGLIRGGD